MRYRYFEIVGICCSLIGSAAPAQAIPERQDTLEGMPVTDIETALEWPDEPGEGDGAGEPDAPGEPSEEDEAGEPSEAGEPDEEDEPAAAPDSCEQRPWTCEASEEEKQQALALFQEANQLFDDSLFINAVDAYRGALDHWDHPSIHYNLMLALVALDRPIEAYESSLAALQHGPEVLQPDEYLRARDYHKLLRGRIAVLEVSCSEPGAVVSLDGELLFRAPGTVRRFVLPGKHELVSRKPKYLTTHQTLVLEPDKDQKVQVALLPAGQALITIRSWKRWQPWAAVGAGAGIGLLSAAFEWRAHANNRILQSLFKAECPAPAGCPMSLYSDAVKSRIWRSTWYRRVGHGAAIAGAATAITGLVFVYLNRPQQMENPLRRHMVRISVTPAIQPESAGMSVRVDF